MLVGLMVLINVSKKNYRFEATQIQAARPLFDSLVSSFITPSISAGIGLVYRFDPIRIELNLGMPLTAAKSDIAQRGFQVGIGLDFL